ncbi:hypothetical protein AAG906_015014 [Vitis piasezkii]
MGEENKEEKKEEAKKEGKEEKEEEKKEEKKEEEPQEIVLKVDMHCEACARKVARALKGFQGVEDVTTDSKASKVVFQILDLLKPTWDYYNPDRPPPVITAVLKVYMHCEACAQVLQRRIRKFPGVESVTTDVANDQAIVKGIIEPAKKKKKEEEKKEKKEGQEGEKKDEEEGKGEDDKKTDVKRSEYWPTKDYLEFASYHPQFFSDENPNACSVM